MAEPARRGWCALFATTDHEIREKVRHGASSLLALTPELLRCFGHLAARLSRANFMPHLTNVQVARAEQATVLARSREHDRLDAELGNNLLRTTRLEERLALVPPVSLARWLGLLAVGLSVPMASTIAISALLFGPTLRFLVVPLVASAARDTAGLLSAMSAALGVDLPTGDLVSLLAPAFLIGLARVISVALGVTVVLVPDLAGLFGSHRSRGALALVVGAKVAFAAAFMCVRVPDVSRIRLPIIAGSIFELAVIGVSCAVSIVVSKHLDELRAWSRERAAARALIHTQSVHQRRLLQRSAELATSLADAREASFGADGDAASILTEVEQRGRAVAEAELVATVAHNVRVLEEAKIRLHPRWGAELTAQSPSPLIH